MRQHRRARAVMVALGTILLLLTAGAAQAAAAAPVVRALDDAGVRSYWTPQRMRAAEPLEVSAGREPSPAHAGVPSGEPKVVEGTDPGGGEVEELSSGLAGEPATRASGDYTRSEINDPSQEDVRMHGKVFLTVQGGSEPGNYVCSGTAVSSNNRSVVWTAGHCVFDTEGGGFATNWMFAPAYHNGATPFGEWPAQKLASTKQWKSSGNLKYDMGAAVVQENGSGQALTEVVGSRGIGFNQSRHQKYRSYGYPAQQPPLEFTGGREFRCNSGLGGTDNPGGSGPNTNWIGCDMTGGSSGGGWVAGDDLLGLNSYSYCAVVICEERLYGPYFGDDAKQLYKSVTGKASFCMGHKVTYLGTKGDDTLVGTSGNDVFKAKGGDDTIIGRDGNDRVCAGSGNDVAKGLNGKDTLKGQRGRDELLGGKGRRDSCDGGPGHDRAKGCEKRRRI